MTRDGLPAVDLDLQDALTFAHELADLADAITLAAFREGVDVATKSDGSPVTAADHDVEQRLRSEIQTRFPDHAILGEEGGRLGPQGAPTWVLDPIDGTANFARGMPVFATLVALHADGRNVVGVVSAPALGDRWDGVEGGDARHNGRQVRVSTTSELADAHVSFGGLKYFSRRDWTALVDALTASTLRQRGFGDFWQHCLVASGAVDVALEAEVSRWDLAAVKVVVEAAGGRLTALDGSDTDAGGTALSSNGHLHRVVLDIISRHAGGLRPD